MKIWGNSISLTKGDTEEFTVWQTKEDVHVPFASGDTVYFTVKTSTNTTSKILQKVITNFIDGKAVVRLEHEETEIINVGNYVYDIQVTSANGTVKTIVKPAKFTVTPEVTND